MASERLSMFKQKELYKTLLNDIGIAVVNPVLDGLHPIVGKFRTPIGLRCLLYKMYRKENLSKKDALKAALFNAWNFYRRTRYLYSGFIGGFAVTTKKLSDEFLKSKKHYYPYKELGSFTNFFQLWKLIYALYMEKYGFKKRSALRLSYVAAKEIKDSGYQWRLGTLQLLTEKSNE